MLEITTGGADLERHIERRGNRLEKGEMDIVYCIISGLYIIHSDTGLGVRLI